MEGPSRVSLMGAWSSSSMRDPQQRVKKILTRPLARGGSRATTLALITSAVGAGVFTMPYGFSRAGKRKVS